MLLTKSFYAKGCPTLNARELKWDFTKRTLKEERWLK